MKISSDIEFCTVELRKYDYYRYLCCLLAPEKFRSKLLTIYAFNNEIAKIKDIITEPMAGHIRLQWWRETIDDIYNGAQKDHKNEIVSSLYELISKTKIPKKMFDDLIDAREDDIDFSTPQDLNDIKQYAINTSSNLFYLIFSALNINGQQDHEAAYRAGISYAITGIMRSIKHRAYRKQIMLPKDLMDQNKLTSREVVDGKNIEKTFSVVKAMCDMAQMNLQHVKALSGEISKEAKIALLPTATVSIFTNRIKKNNYDLFNHDIEDGRLQLQLKLLRSRITGRF